MGAKPICSIGYADDGTPNGGIFADLDHWMEATLLPTLQGSNTTTAKRLKVDLPHYHVTIIPTTSTSTSGTVEENNGTDEDDDNGKRIIDDEVPQWLNPQYQSSYNEYFASLSPITAYHYDKSTGRRRRRTRTRKQQTKMETNINNQNDNKQIPLYGQVISNQRITAEGWIQDTRHIQIRVFPQQQQKQQQAMSSSSSSFDEDEENVEEELFYQAGDIATILPSNAPILVQKFIDVLPKSLRILSDHPLEITPSSSSSSSTWPKHCTLRGLFTHCMDLTTPPEREDLRQLAKFCYPSYHSSLGLIQRQKLISLSETMESGLYQEYIIREKRTWVDVFYDFDSLRMEKEDGDDDGNEDDGFYTPWTIDGLLTLIPPLLPRHFSIASAPSSSSSLSSNNVKNLDLGTTENYEQSTTDQRNNKSSNNTCSSIFDIELCVAIVKGKTPLGRTYSGLCSGYLSRLNNNNNNNIHNHHHQHVHDYPIRLWIKPGSFGQLPLHPNKNQTMQQTQQQQQQYFETPILCIGAGTGIAPLRSILHEREIQRQQQQQQQYHDASISNNNNNNNKIMDHTLIFGCRKQNSDYYYQSEWNHLIQSHRLCLLTAFSRDQVRRIYVQTILREEEEGIVKNWIEDYILSRSTYGVIYIAGGASMARAVREVLMDLLVEILLFQMMEKNEQEEEQEEKKKKKEKAELMAQKILKQMQRDGKLCIEAWN